MYQIIYSKKAKKAINKLPDDIASNIILSIDNLQYDPFSNIKKIKGTGDQHLYSHRTGQHRVILTIQNDKLIIMILDVSHRKNVHRKY